MGFLAAVASEGKGKAGQDGRFDIPQCASLCRRLAVYVRAVFASFWRSLLRACLRSALRAFCDRGHWLSYVDMCVVVGVLALEIYIHARVLEYDDFKLSYLIMRCDSTRSCN